MQAPIGARAILSHAAPPIASHLRGHRDQHVAHFVVLARRHPIHPWTEPGFEGWTA